MSSPLRSPLWPRVGLYAVVVVVFAIYEPGLVVTVGVQGHRLPEGPTREGPRGHLDVVLRVVADAHREKLHELSPVVLVGIAVVVLVVVQPEDHARVAGEVEQDGAEVRHAVAAEHVVLRDEGRRVFALVVRAGEDVVPKERHLLLQGPLGVNHAVDPLRAVPRQGVEVDERPVIPSKKVILDFGEPLGVQEVLDYVLVWPLGLSFEFVSRRAKTGATIQVSHEGDLLVRHVRLRMLGWWVDTGLGCRPLSYCRILFETTP